METGQRKDADGKTIPRSIINLFTATFAGAEVFTAELHPGISANPYLSFFMKVPGPGEFEFTWVDDAGSKVVEKMKLNVRRRQTLGSDTVSASGAGSDPAGLTPFAGEVARCPTSRSAPRRAPTR